MTVRVYYRPADPVAVEDVLTLTLDGTDYGPGVRVGNRWAFDVTEPAPGTYTLDVLVNYTDGTSEHDTNDTLTFPAPAPASDGDPILLWCKPTDLVGVGGIDEAVLALACRIATNVLYELSGQRWDGLRVSSLEAPLLPTYRPIFIPHGLAGSYHTFTSHTDGRGISLGRWATHLPGVREVLSMTVAGTVVDVETVAIEDRTLLHVQPTLNDAGALAYNRCPCGCGLSLFPGVGGCMSVPRADVTVTWGIDPPDEARFAARLFAAEIAKGATGGTCGLSMTNVQSVSQEGVSVLLDPQTYLQQRRTGLPLVDVWLTALPARTPAATIWSPDLPMARRTS